MKAHRCKAERSQEIVDAAVELFVVKGLAASTLEETAKRPGISKPTLYLRYATKEALFEAVVKSFVSCMVSEVCVLILGFQGNFAELLPRLLTSVMSNVETTRVPAAMLNNFAEVHARTIVQGIILQEE